MAYIDPPAFAGSEVLAAADLNVAMDDIRALKVLADSVAFCGVSLGRPAAQSIPTTVHTSVSWSEAPIDSSGWWSSGTDAVVPADAVPPGYSQAVLEIDIQASYATNGTGLRAVEVTVNGGVVEYQFKISAITGDTTQVAQTVWAQVSVGDIVNGKIYQSSGGDLAASEISMHIKRIGVIV